MSTTRNRWAHEYISTTNLAHKLRPPPIPEAWDAGDAVQPPQPGRPTELTVVAKSPKSPKAGALIHARERARILHTFLHHELQAAELMCWAALAFPDTPEAFRNGLLGIAVDEIRHLNLYREHIERLGHRFGEFGVRDWFWQRVSSCATPTQFVALMGMGFEGANLEHSTLWAQRFRDVGDDLGAEVQEQVGREELRHVRFALRWFATWTDGSFESWVRSLPPPITPTVLRGRSMDRAMRKQAGFTDDFLDALASWTKSPGS
jgi:uncharacterized ferritin-like protein (DUF455 family)